MKEETRSETLRIDAVSKWYSEEVNAVKRMSLTVEPGEFMVFVGPSGCGKSTMLRMIAGLEKVDEGEIYLGEQRLNSLPSQRRDIAMVFQNYALYPTMNVFQNIAFPLKMRHWKKPLMREQVDRIAGKLGLEELLQRRVSELSGGQRQRVALGRAMIRSPKLFLMDEPLSNLDARLRVRMRREIVLLQRELGVTTIYVTHDQVEAMTMGSRIAVMRDGVLQQVDTPQNIYRRPANLFVAQFIGSPPMNLWESRVERAEGTLSLSLGKQRLSLPQAVSPFLSEGLDCMVKVGVRPEEISIKAPGEEGTVRAEVAAVEYTGRESFVYLDLDGLTEPLICSLGGECPYQGGETVGLQVDPGHLHFFSSETGERLE